jgi:hypothetical protein
MRETIRYKGAVMAEQVLYKIIQAENVIQAQEHMQLAANEGYRFVAFAPDARSNRIYIVMERRTA